MFDDYAKKLEALGENVPQIFKGVAKKGAVHFRNEAVKGTDREELVDTGNYRRSWNGEAVDLGNDEYGIACSNNVEYASHLEYGHKLRNGKRWRGRFVGTTARQETEGSCLLELFREIQIAMTAKKLGISKSEARKRL